MYSFQLKRAKMHTFKNKIQKNYGTGQSPPKTHLKWGGRCQMAAAALGDNELETNLSNRYTCCFIIVKQN